MQHIYGLQDTDVNGAWITIGKFDGVHIGHQSIIKELTTRAHAVGAPAVVLTFDPHPSIVLRGKRDCFYLSLPEEKAKLLGDLGVDLVVTHPFNIEVAKLSAEQFLANVNAALGLKQLWVGHDFTLGHNREGDLPRLRQIGEQMGFSVHDISAVTRDGEVVSSSRIRALLEAGAVETANMLLGRSFIVYGKVISGEGRGKKIGIPTANLDVPKERVMPGAGVYASWVHWKGSKYRAVTNVGVRPTFENEPVAPRIEPHILDFDQDLYGEEIVVSFEARLRGEQRFPGKDALVAQINTDIEKARVLLQD